MPARLSLAGRIARPERRRTEAARCGLSLTLQARARSLSSLARPAPQAKPPKTVRPQNRAPSALFFFFCFCPRHPAPGSRRALSALVAVLRLVVHDELVIDEVKAVRLGLKRRVNHVEICSVITARSAESVSARTAALC